MLPAPLVICCCPLFASSVIAPLPHSPTPSERYHAPCLRYRNVFLGRIKLLWPVLVSCLLARTWDKGLLGSLLNRLSSGRLGTMTSAHSGRLPWSRSSSSYVAPVAPFVCRLGGNALVADTVMLSVVCGVIWSGPTIDLFSTWL